MSSVDEDKYKEVMNRVAKWRFVFASWQLGTRSNTDPECQAVKDHRELGIMLRIEVSALANLLIEKGVITLDEYKNQMITEAEFLDAAFEKKFPGFTSSDVGMSVNVEKAKETTKFWRK